jgi:hypothetical protein
VLIDAVSRQRVDVLPDSKAATLAMWLREHPGAEVVCRDGSAAYAEAIRQGAPQAVQGRVRWHLRHGLGGAVKKTVIAHSTCWYAQSSALTRPIDERTRGQHAAVHELLGQGVGLFECARRLGWALNTVKRYTQRRTAAAATALRPHPDRPLPRAPAPPAGRRTRRGGHSAVRRDSRAGLHLQRQPARALPQPRPRPIRARSPATAAARRVDHEQTRRPARTRPQPPRRVAGRLPALAILTEHVRAFADLLPPAEAPIS